MAGLRREWTPWSHGRNQLGDHNRLLLKKEVISKNNNDILKLLSKYKICGIHLSLY